MGYPKSKKSGFTIIEVVLVLAIAGLIMMMVFVAMPALQRAQKNKQRKEDLSRFLTAAIEYSTNNSGKNPWQDNRGWNDVNVPVFVKRYIDSEAEFTIVGANDVRTDACSEAFRDPDGTCYKFREGIDFSTDYSPVPVELKTTGWTKGDHFIRVATGARCGITEEDIEPTGKPGDIMMFYQEPANPSMWHDHRQAPGAVMCVDNQ